MRRFSREQIALNPRLATVDRESTERMCRRARHAPIAIFNFVEGTRFTVAKRDAQQSPFQHLLRPKAGGIAQVLSLLGDQLDGIFRCHHQLYQPIAHVLRLFYVAKKPPLRLKLGRSTFRSGCRLLITMTNRSTRNASTHGSIHSGRKKIPCWTASATTIKPLADDLRIGEHARWLCWLVALFFGTARACRQLDEQYQW